MSRSRTTLLRPALVPYALILRPFVGNVRLVWKLPFLRLLWLPPHLVEINLLSGDSTGSAGKDRCCAKARIKENKYENRAESSVIGDTSISRLASSSVAKRQSSTERSFTMEDDWQVRYSAIEGSFNFRISFVIHSYALMKFKIITYNSFIIFCFVYYRKGKNRIIL